MNFMINSKVIILPNQGNVGVGGGAGGTTLVQNMMAGTESIVQNVLVDHHHGTGGPAALVQNIVEGGATLVPAPPIPPMQVKRKVEL